MTINAGNVSTWTPALVAPLAAYPDVYPYSGWSAQWAGTAGKMSGYGGQGQINAPKLNQYPQPAGTTALAWTDQTQAVGNLCLMAFDANAIAVIAGDSTLTNTSGGLAQLVAGRTFSVSTNAYCPGWAGGNLARFRLVTNTVTGSGGATTTSSPAITTNGPMGWTFTIPAGAVTAYLAVESLTANPENVVRFTKPVVLAQMGANSTALGYLGGANAVPIRVTQIQMPAYYRKAGWPTPASYLLNAPGSLSFSASTLPGTVGQPVVVDPTSIDTAADLRFLAGVNYSQATGTWSPYKSSGVHPMVLHAGNAPYYASAADNRAYHYNVATNTPATIPSLLFTPTENTWLYSDDFNALGLTEYTVILVLSAPNTFNGRGGLWSSAPKAAGGGPDTDADASAFNYRVVDTIGYSLQVQSLGMQPRTFSGGRAAGVHKPTYLAMTFRDSANVVTWADFPGSVSSVTMALAGVSGALAGSVVLGADAINGLASGLFWLFELNVYFGAMTPTQVQRQINMLGQIYG